MPHSGLPLALAAILGLTPPLDAARQDQLHNSGRAHRARQEHLLAADEWLTALAGVELTDAAVDHVKNHFCEAVKSLQDAADDPGSAGGVDERVQRHREHLRESEAFLRRSSSGASLCITAWEALDQAYPPPAAPAVPAPAEPPVERPTPPQDDRRRGLRIAFISSLGLTLGFSAAALGTGLSVAYDRNDPNARQGAAYKKVWEAADATTRSDSDAALCPDGVSGELADACAAYRHTQRAAVASIVLASAGFVTTAVLGGLLGKGRGRANHRDVAVRPGGTLTRDRFLLQLRVDF